MLFVTDPHDLREARKEAALHRLAYHRAKDARTRYSHHRRAWELAKARVAALEARYA